MLEDDVVLEEITKEVEKASPGIVVVDSFRTVVPEGAGWLNRSGAAIFHSAVSLTPDQLASHDLSGRRRCRGRDP